MKSTQLCALHSNEKMGASLAFRADGGYVSLAVFTRLAELHIAGGFNKSPCDHHPDCNVVLSLFFLIQNQSCAWLTTPPLMLRGLKGHTVVDNLHILQFKSKP